MQLNIKKSEFLKGLYLAQSVADRKSTLPILANVLLRSEGKDYIICSATDLKVSILSEVPAEIIQEGGVCLSAKYLFEIIKNLSDEEIHLTKNENNWAEITSGKAKYQIVGMPDRDFPKIPDSSEVLLKEVDAKTLLEMINKTSFSISNDETRKHLSGVLFEWEGKRARMVSTDGHRMSKAETDIGEGLDLSKGIIIPRKGVLELRKLLEGIDGTAEIGIKDNELFIRGNDLIMAIKLVDAQFPPYNQVIPKENEKKIVVNRLSLLESLRRLLVMTSDKGTAGSKGIHIELSEGLIKITSENLDLGEGEEEFEVDYKGKKLIIGFNAQYYIDVLNEINEEKVLLEFNGELDPGVISPVENKNYVGVIMPMRI